MFSLSSKNFISTIFLFMGLFLTSGCELVQVSGPKVASSTCSALGVCGNSSGDSSGNGGASTINSAPFTLSIKSYWYNDETKAYPHEETGLYHIKKVSGEYVSTGSEDDLDETDTCNIKKGINISSDSVDRHRTCGLLIPETRLYFSKLDLTVNIAKDAGCEVVYFTPLSYRASSSSTFKPAWENDSINCSVAKPPIGCFSGPGIKLVPGYPSKVGLVHTLLQTNTPSSLTWTAESAFQNNRGDNRWSAYYPLEPSPVLDWEFECVNEGSKLNYKYTLRIIPTRDSGDDVAEGWSRYLGWVDEYGIFNSSGF